ncbi:MAG: hypothetical protein K0Q73_1980 [Paenibacillus sp.]|jgi:hypothetical protein|nr:hypothetical protein [Paenibacillus sp.]
MIKHEVEYQVTHPRATHSGTIVTYGVGEKEIRERALIAIVEQVKYSRYAVCLNSTKYIEIGRIRCVEKLRKRF